MISPVSRPSWRASWKLPCALATLVLSMNVTGVGAQTLKVDFNDKAAEITQSGWEAFSSTTDPNNKTQNYSGYDDLAGAGNDVSITSGGIEFSRDAGLPSGTGSDDMSRDLVFRNDADAVITITIEGLLAGNYELRTHHHVESAGGGPERTTFVLDVEDANSVGFGQAVGSFMMGGNGTPTDSGGFVVTANGSDAVVLRLTATNIPGGGGRDWWGINGLEIATVSSSPPVDITLSGSTFHETRPTGSTVGTLDSVDPSPGDTHSYALVAGPGDANNALFQIVGNEVRTQASFSGQAGTDFSIRIRTTDFTALSFEKSFVLTAIETPISPSGALRIDFSPTGGPVEPGWEGYFATQESGSSFTPQDFTGFGATITVHPTWAADATNASKQMYDRSSSGYPGAHQDLINQWIGTDGRLPGNPLTLTLSGLPAGRYLWRSFHHDPQDQTGVFSANVSDATGAQPHTGIPITDAIQDGVVDFGGVSVFETEILSDGSTPISLEFDLTSSTGNIATAFFLMNGFELLASSTAALPAPGNGATGVDSDTSLSWTAPTEYVASGYHLYFGTDPNPYNNPVIPLAVPIYDPPADLARDTTFYWVVDSYDGATKHVGDVWSFSTMPPQQPADQVAGKLVLFNDNGQWCWYQDERAIYDPVADMIVFSSIGHSSAYGGAARDGDQDISAFHVASGTRFRTTVRENYTSYGTGNDHHAGALWIRPDGRYFHKYTGHNESSFNHWCNLTTLPNDPANWGDGATFHWPASLGTSHGSTYTNLFFMSAEGANGRLYNISREGNERTPMIAYSDDWGDSWSFGGKLCQGNGSSYSNGYTVLAGNGTDRIDFMITEHHPRNYNNSIYHGYIKGGKSYDSSGAVVDDDIFDDSDAPIASDFTRVFQAEAVEAGNYHHAWTAEIEVDATGGVHGLFTTRYGTATDVQTGDKDHRLFYTRWDGAQWHTTELCKMGGGIRLNGENDYTGLGAIHPDNPDLIYVSTPLDPRDDVRTDHAEIYKGITTDQGATWTWTPVTADSTEDNYRPIIPAWDANHTAVLWLRGDYTQSGPRSQTVVGVIEREDEAMGQVTYVDASPDNTTLADGSSLTTTGPSGSNGSGDGQWHSNSSYGNGGSVLASGETAPENAPALKTSISGLADGTYEVFVFFWANPEEDWRIRAGFSEVEQMVFQRVSSQQAPTDSFDGVVRVLDSSQALYRAYVGRRTVTSGETVEVLIDDFDGAAAAGSERTAYDGIGVAKVLPVLQVESGDSLILPADSGPYDSIRNEGALILKGEADLEVVGTFANDGFLDLLSYFGSLPAGFVNNGSILDRTNANSATSIAVDGNKVSISIPGYAGHSYQLQSSTTLQPDDWQNLGTPSSGSGLNGVSVPLDFSDADALLGSKWKFYRHIID